jgi:multidrug efflux pump subunit AcrA (membrane-fusion protein)
VRLWQNLASAVAAGGETLDVPTADEGQAPQVEAALDAYLDESHARRLIVVPLAVAEDKVIGVLTVEQIAAARDDRDAALGRLSSLVPHAVSALANASRYDALPLRFLAAVPGTIRAVTALRNLPKTAIVVGLLASLVAALVLVPWDFTVEAPGTLQPVVRRDVFASVDGTVERLFVGSADRVARGDPLVELRSNDLDFAEADLVKRASETEQELLNAERLYNQGRTLSPEQQAMLPAEIAVLEQRRESLKREAALLAEKRKLLRIESPLDGQISTWNVAELLDQRPVRKGQALLSLVAPEGDWEVEVRLPEDRLGHVVEAQRGTKPQLDVTFATATEPGKEYRGTIASVGLAAEPHGEEGNVVRVRTAIDKRQLAELHPGADVRVRVHCGTRPLGYVLFHDVWAFVQSQILFRL